ncbi:hypothetical protein WT27_12615 [Burkholderia territorii]|uniref:Uncharacterized protein n=1 Tax=Burkholderia territorii TaxID=1503055 RepID=A0A105V3X3_9BURK|nr:hypothetical protein [Burkholderia territorii]KVV40768.1 hypothetical protein WT27_12615 [Burkholderia territorii]KVX33716.1 hypothetical protein WT31_08520 [Burkholderia territorii]
MSVVPLDEPGAATAEHPQTSAQLKLTPRHRRRLTHYFRGGSSGALFDPIDLDLIGMALVERDPRSPHRLLITAAGDAALYHEKQLNRASHRPHDSLAERIASNLETQGRLCFLNLKLHITAEYPVIVVRPDVFSVAKTLNEKTLRPIIHEVKASRADLLADIKRPSKREGYLQLAERVFYVVPEGVATAEDIPAECGLILASLDGQFKIAKRAPKSALQRPLTTLQWMALTLRLAGRNTATEAN